MKEVGDDDRWRDERVRGLARGKKRKTRYWVTLKRIKDGEAKGLDGAVMELFRFGNVSLMEWLL